MREFVVEVTTPAGEVFRAKVGQPRNSTNFWDPRIGQRVLVESDPESRKVRFNEKDLGLNAKMQIKANESTFDSDLNMPTTGVGGCVPYERIQCRSDQSSQLRADQLQQMMASMQNATVVQVDLPDAAKQALRESFAKPDLTKPTEGA